MSYPRPMPLCLKRSLDYERPICRLPVEVHIPDLNPSLALVHSAVASLLVAADGAGAAWAVPRAPGKWSPSQVVEHVARIMEESANVAAGAASKFPTIPFFLRPIARLFVFRRILRRKAFLKMKTGEGFDPQAGSVTVAAARVRLEDALTRFEQACLARAGSGQQVSSTIFGKVSVSDFVRFQELHVRHHLLQMPGAA
jgi:hypothetical protein